VGVSWTSQSIPRHALLRQNTAMLPRSA
jgi:hypothetical protein